MMADRSFGSEIQSARHIAGISQRELAKRVGVDFTYISKIENGRCENSPSVKTILAICEVLGLDTDAMVKLAQKSQVQVLEARIKELEADKKGVTIMDFIRNHLLQIQILVESRALPIYFKDNRYWIPGEAGKPYVISVVNLGSAARLEILESVDGRNVLQDEPASFRNQGMVINGTWNNPGWRLNDNEIREFVFSDPSAAIAAQATGSTSNVGVIGVAAFTEKLTAFRQSGGYLPKGGLSGARGQSFSAEVKSLAAADLGTGMGDLRHDSVGHTSFERSTNTPAVKVEIQYRSMAWLVSQGIVGPDLPSAWREDETGYGRYAK